MHTMSTEAAAAAAAGGCAHEEPGRPFMSLRGARGLGRALLGLPSAAANIWACGLPRRHAVCPSSLFPTAAPPSSPRRRSLKGGADCRQMFKMLPGLSRSRAASTSLAPRARRCACSETAQWHQVHICQAHACEHSVCTAQGPFEPVKWLLSSTALGSQPEEEGRLLGLPGTSPTFTCPAPMFPTPRHIRRGNY